VLIKNSWAVLKIFVLSSINTDHMKEVLTFGRYVLTL